MTGILENRRLPFWLLVAATVLMVPLMVHLQRGGLLWADAMPFATDRAKWSLDWMLLAHNGQFMPTTWLAFNINNALFWPSASGIPMVLSIGTQLALVWGVFVWSRRRVDDWYAAAFALLIMTYGAGHEVLTWSFNFGWLIALSAGLWSLIVFESEPHSRRKLILAGGLLLLSVLGDNLGLIFGVAIGAQVLFKESRRRALQVATLPVALWGLWYLQYGRGSESDFMPKSFAYISLRLIESSFNGFVFNMAGWAAPLTVLGVGVIAVRLWRMDRFTPTLVTAIALPTVFTAMLVLSRSYGDPAVSRYVYTFAFLVVLLFAEVLRGVKMQTVGQLAVTAAILGFLVYGNLTVMASGADVWRQNVETNKVYNTALAEVGREAACTTDYDPPDPLLQPFNNCTLYETFAAYGRHTYSKAELAAQPADVQEKVRTYVKAIRE